MPALAKFGSKTIENPDLTSNPVPVNNDSVRSETNIPYHVRIK